MNVSTLFATGHGPHVPTSDRGLAKRALPADVGPVRWSAAVESAYRDGRRSLLAHRPGQRTGGANRARELVGRLCRQSEVDGHGRGGDGGAGDYAQVETGAVGIASGDARPAVGATQVDERLSQAGFGPAEREAGWWARPPTSSPAPS
jgi:hypothetical protein